MTVTQAFSLGLLVRSTAYAQRSSRSQLDVALLAATLDCDLHLFFAGAGVLQLVPRGDTSAAQLPAAYRAWASLPDLFESAELRAFAEPTWLDKLGSQGLNPCLQLEPCPPGEMRQQWLHCHKVMVL